ncbi:DUF6445 family protein [Amantichitinum ursilacus]|uniref:Uncharacterized protein n=1 Tax=Amantichitinum ursilacus TaxID=857265 RepID=A0A0N0XLY2_9NEIS|nr:DUF6445 family protein [Amantichitinum ursilacus]KPC53704.1 hypothetical protein WG78_07670 [Amantichitinum ursilacus]
MGEKKRKLAAGNVAVATGPAERAQQVVVQGLQVHRQGRLADALALYQKALTIKPDHAEAIHYQGLALASMGQGAVGAALLQKSLALAPDHAEFHFNTAQFLRPHDPFAAATHFYRAHEIAPADALYALGYAEHLLTKPDAPAALEVLLSTGRLATEDFALAERIVALAYELDQVEIATEFAARARMLKPEDEGKFRVGFARPQAGVKPVETTLSATDLKADMDDAQLAQFVAERDLHVIDNVIADPVAWREHALSQQFHAQVYAGQNYPGVQTEGQPAEATMQLLANVLGRTVKWSSPDNGAFRVSFAESEARTDIHIDNEAEDGSRCYAAVLYLNAPEHCHGGTMFWRHQETGWQKRPLDSELAAAGYEGLADFHARCLSNDRSQPFNELAARRATWTPTAELPMQSNRLVTYRGDYYHSLSNVFGSTMQDGRLVQLFFFDVV